MWFVVAAGAATLAVSAAAQPVIASASSYATRGNPTTAIATADGRYVFVSVTNVGAPNFTGPDAAAGERTNVISAIEVFRSRGRAHQLTPVGLVRIGGVGANGMSLLRGGRTLVVGVGDDGVAFLDVRNLIHGRGTPVFAPQGNKAGTFDVVATPDGRFVFSSNEYGALRGRRGNVGVISTGIDAAGRVLHPKTLGRISTGDVVPSLALSPDGSRLYVASELVPSGEDSTIAGSSNPLLTRHDCVQRLGTPPRGNGMIAVIETQKAEALEFGTILSRVAAGCSPVRIDEAGDASALYVSARGDDAILVFDPRRLESDPDHALLRSLHSGGAAPVGVRLFDADSYLAVANSNRFANGNGNLAILRVRGNVGATPVELLSEGGFPRNISRSADGNILYLTNYTSRTLEVIRLRSIRPAGQ